MTSTERSVYQNNHTELLFHIFLLLNRISKRTNDLSIVKQFSSAISDNSFFIRTKNEYPFTADLAIRTLLGVCTTYLCDATFSKLTTIIKSKNRRLLKMLKMSFLLRWLMCQPTNW